MPITCYFFIAVGAYLLGSIPFGFVAARVKGIDIRSVGSGNIGATNAMRVLGKPIGIFVLLMDALKGYVAVKYLSVAVIHFAGGKPMAAIGDSEIEQLQILAGIFAVVGHNYTCWLKFKGGKGIATSAGVYIALAWPALLIALAVFILAVAITRYISVGSISAAIALSAAVWAMQPHNVLLGIVTTALSALAIYKHKSNIQRLMAGTENRFGKKKEEAK